MDAEKEFRNQLYALRFQIKSKVNTAFWKGLRIGLIFGFFFGGGFYYLTS